MFVSKSSVVLGFAVALAAAWAAPSAQAAVYSTLSAGNFTLSNISDNTGAYGQPTLDAAGHITFTDTNFAFASSSNGGSNGISYRLTFEVTLTEGTAAPKAELNEFGIVNKIGTGGIFGIFPHIALFNDPLTIPLVPIDSKTGDVVFSSVTDWSSDVKVGGTAAVKTYWVVIDNDFLTVANLGGTVAIDKKIVLIDLGDNTTGGGEPGVPEPATFGVVALGAMALLAKRRR